MKRQSCPSPINKVTVEQVASPGAEHRLGRAYELILRAAGQADQANEAGSEKAVKPEKSGDGYSGHSPDHSTPEQAKFRARNSEGVTDAQRTPSRKIRIHIKAKKRNT